MAFWTKCSKTLATHCRNSRMAPSARFVSEILIRPCQERNNAFRFVYAGCARQPARSDRFHYTLVRQAELWIYANRYYRAIGSSFMQNIADMNVLETKFRKAGMNSIGIRPPGMNLDGPKRRRETRNKRQNHLHMQCERPTNLINLSTSRIESRCVIMSPIQTITIGCELSQLTNAN